MNNFCLFGRNATEFSIYFTLDIRNVKICRVVQKHTIVIIAPVTQVLYLTVSFERGFLK